MPVEDFLEIPSGLRAGRFLSHGGLPLSYGIP